MRKNHSKRESEEQHIAFPCREKCLERLVNGEREFEVPKLTCRSSREGRRERQNVFGVGITKDGGESARLKLNVNSAAQVALDVGDRRLYAMYVHPDVALCSH